MPIEKVTEILDSGRDNHFDSACVDAFYNLTAEQVLRVMESEREQTTSEDVSVLKAVKWKRMVELVSGATPKRGEEDFKNVFDRMYNFGLPENYKPLD